MKHKTTLNKNMKIFIILLLLPLLSSRLYAEDSKFSIGLSISNNDIEHIPSKFIDNGYKFDLGYSINDIFSVELSYFDFGSINQDIEMVPNPPLPPSHIPTSIKYKIKALDLSLLAKHKWNNFSLYAKVGWLASDSEQKIFVVQGLNEQFNDSGANLSYGVGMGYDINNHFMINLDHTASSLESVDFKITSVGLRYRF